MATAADDRAPGGSITVALCGSRSHEPPCPLARTTPWRLVGSAAPVGHPDRLTLS